MVRLRVGRTFSVEFVNQETVRRVHFDDVTKVQCRFETRRKRMSGKYYITSKKCLTSEVKIW